MREFKFRVFYKNDFTYFDLDLLNDESRAFYVNEINGNQVIQYTGLKDKNGIEIYEGDIVKYKYTSREQIAEIKYNKEKLGFDFADNKVNLSYAYNFRQINNIEVIGNIYENPEVLKA